jgi:hypothetical protein
MKSSYGKVNYFYLNLFPLLTGAPNERRVLLEVGVGNVHFAAQNLSSGTKTTNCYERSSGLGIKQRGLVGLP